MISRIKVVLPLPNIPQTVTIFMIYLSIVGLMMIQIANVDGIVKECGLSKFTLRNTQGIPVVKIIVLTRGVHASCPYGQHDCCPIPLSCRIALDLEQTETF